jgi:hypothetical protein
MTSAAFLSAVQGSPANREVVHPRGSQAGSYVLAATAFLDREQAPDAGLLQDASWLLDRGGTYLQARTRLDVASPSSGAPPSLPDSCETG